MKKNRKKGPTKSFATETQYNMDTGLPVVSFTKLNGILQATPDGKPSYVLFDEYGRPEMMQWHDLGEVHREEAPATIYIDPETEVHTLEAFYIRGNERPKDQGPCRIWRDADTGKVTREEFLGSSHPQTRQKPRPTT